MVAFAPPATEQTSLTVEQQVALAPVIAANCAPGATFRIAAQGNGSRLNFADAFEGSSHKLRRPLPSSDHLFSE